MRRPRIAEDGIQGDEVEIGWLHLETLKTNDLLFCDSLLSEHERARAARFHFQMDRVRFVAAHALLRLMLSRHAPVRPEAWHFEARAHGKPFVAGPSGTGLRFNLSHSQALVACAITRVGEVGVDVETINRQFPAVQVAQRYFAQEEIETLRNTAPQYVADTFTTIWVLKEALLKAVGEGLSIPLDSFAFCLNPPRLCRDPGFLLANRKWRFHVFAPTPDHVLALAVQDAAETIQIKPKKFTLVAPDLFQDDDRHSS